MNPLAFLKNLDLQTLGQSIREVIADPASNLTAAVLLVGVVSIVLLILVIVVLLLLAPGSEEDEEDEEAEEGAEEPISGDEAAASAPEIEEAPERPIPEWRRRLRRIAMRVSLFAIPLLLVAAFVSGYLITSQTRYCLSCHSQQMSAFEETDPTGLTASPKPVHPKVACVRCHEDDQLWGAVGNTFDRTRHVVAFVAGKRTGRNASVPSGRCLTCHEAVTKKAVADTGRGLVMSHAEPEAAGVPCRECHENVGHYPAAKRPAMSSCLRCHDGAKVASECKTCHTKEPALAASDRRSFAANARITREDCGGCHDQKKCDACHGLRMPHDKVFLAYGHAKLAAFDGREKWCWPCHVEGDCGKCHLTNGRLPGYWGHTSGTDWKWRHGRITPPKAVAGCGCHGRSPWVQRGQDYCLECHAPGIR